MHRLPLLLACLHLLMSAPAHAAGIQVRVGLYENPPKMFTRADGSAAGIMVDILDQVARQEGWQVVYVACVWQECLRQLSTGTIDLLPDVAYTEQRHLEFDFHQIPALHSWAQVFRNEQVPIASILDLEGKRVAVLDGGVQEEQFERLLHGFGLHVQMVPTRTYEDAFELASRGKVDAALTNRHFGDFNAARYGLLDTGIYFNPTALYFATGHGRHAELLQALDQHLSAWVADSGSVYYAILRHWRDTPQEALVPRWLQHTLLTLSVLLLVSGAFVLFLRRRLHTRTRSLREMDSRLRSTLDALPDLLFEVDAGGRFLDYHTPHAGLLAVQPQDFLGRHIRDVMPPDVAATCERAIAEAATEGEAHGHQFALQLAEETHWFELSIARKDDPAAVSPSFIVLSRDITDRKTMEQQLQRLSNLYGVLSQCNQAIVRSDDEEMLFPVICRDVVTLGGMSLAWIARLTPEGTALHTVSAFGRDSERVADQRYPLTAEGPLQSVAASLQACWCEEASDAPALLDRLGLPGATGWHSLAVLPITCKQRVAGVFVLLADEARAFDDAERRLLQELAMDISFALDRFADNEALRQANQQLQDKDELYRTAFFTSPDAINITRLGDGMYLDVNEGFERITGWTRAEVIGKTALELNIWTDPADRERLVAALRAHGTCENLEAVFSLKDGRTINGLMSARVVEIKGETCLLSITRDITRLKAAEASLRQLSLAVEQSPNTIVITDLAARIEYVNQAFTQITGYSAQEAIGQNPRFLQSGQTPRETFQELWQDLSAGRVWKGELTNKRKDGSIYIESAIISPVRQADGRITHYLAVKENITERRQAEARMRHLANFDQLTGLPNRHLLNERLDQAISETARNGSAMAVMFLDLDHFQNINDSLGHSIGDRYLVEVSARLKAAVREEDTVARLGGDEFILLFPGIDADAAAVIASKLIESVSQPCHIDQHELVDTPSIGIAIYPEDGHSGEELLKNADIAMNRLKQGTRNDFRFFTPEMQAHSTRTMLLLSALRQALARGELHLHYQPQISLRDGGVIGAEALLRWRHPELGNISPAEFIPLAEDSGLIIPIGEWVLHSAAAQMKRWQEAGLPLQVVAVNLSAVQFHQPDLPERVTHILEQVGLAPERLELELTEAVAMDDPQGAVAMMDKLHARGIRLSIDDFGTGYSSLSYLKRFNVYKLKIDQSFVRDLTEDPEDKAIVTAIINLASSLGMQTIAEGVETPGQLAFLRLQGCHEVQGYYFSKPLDAAAFEAYLRQPPT